MGPFCACSSLLRNNVSPIRLEISVCRLDAPDPSVAGSANDLDPIFAQTVCTLKIAAVLDVSLIDEYDSAA